VFWSTVLATVVCALGGYLAFQASLPLCGPPQNTFLGHIYWLVPLGLLLAQCGIVAVAGRKTNRTSATIATTLVAALSVTLIGDVIIFFAFYAAGDCGE